MSIDDHNQEQKSMLTLRAFGYWKSELEPELPDAVDYVGTPYDAEMLLRINQYLLGATVILKAEGKSWCRFGCGEQEMGRKDVSDGCYIWPEGLVHYLAEHAVRLPIEFEKHISTMGTPPAFNATEIANCELDFDWYKK